MECNDGRYNGRVRRLDVSAVFSSLVRFSVLTWREQRVEEEPYSCAGSCGCPTPYSWRKTSFTSVVSWAKKNRVEWLAGITTGLTAVPTAVAFAILAGVKPSVGLRGTWIIMLVMALFGGKVLAGSVVGVACFAWTGCVSLMKMREFRLV